MKFEVRTTPGAEADVAEIHDWIDLVQGRPKEAARWLAGFLKAVDSLHQFPERCPLAPESRSFAAEVRQLLFHRHRILFVIEGNEVRLIRVRHASRRPASEAELGMDG